MNSAYYLCAKCSLTAKCIKQASFSTKNKLHTHLLDEPSITALPVYRTYPKSTKQFGECWALTGKAIQLLKESLTKDAAMNIPMPAEKAEGGEQHANGIKLNAKSKGQTPAMAHVNELFFFSDRTTTNRLVDSS